MHFVEIVCLLHYNALQLKWCRLIYELLANMLNTSCFVFQEGTAAVPKQSKKGRKDVPVSEYPAEVN